jgi:cephalosporin hydroxylase
MTLLELADKYLTDKGSYFFDHKNQVGHNYATLYDTFFSSLRSEPISLFEIGIAKGSSLLMWSEYFPYAKIIGLDIDTTLIDKSRPLGVEGGGWEGRNNITIKQGSQADPECLNKIVSENGLFDIIIDDGSHKTEHQLFSFKHLYNAVKENGYYIIEDIHCDKSEGSFYNTISKNMLQDTFNIKFSWCGLFYTNPNSLTCIIKR